MRTDATQELLKNPKAFTLLALIAFRARFSGGLSVHGLAPGQALIGDHKASGLSPKSYVNAKRRLEKWGLATFQGTNKGTIATLIDSRVFDVLDEYRDKQEDKQGANEGQAKDKQRASNKNGKNVENGKETYLDSESDFEYIWNTYPVKVGKKRAREAFIEARKKGTSTAEISEGLARYKAHLEQRQNNGFRELKFKNGDTWFHQSGWEDEYSLSKEANKPSDLQHLPDYLKQLILQGRTIVLNSERQEFLREQRKVLAPSDYEILRTTI